MKAIGNIYLTWRKGKGHRRIIVGVVKRNSTEGIRFRYNNKGVSEAKKEGFTCYTEFPDLNKEYTQNVMDVFGQRLIKSERADIQKYYDFWEINSEYKDDKYYLLAHTQGLLATDNFEFLADYKPIKGLSFISEICGLSKTNLPSDVVEVGDELQWKPEKGNEYDPDAVMVYKGETFLGYVKKVHCKVFRKPGGENLKIAIKSIEKNGHISKAFIKIYLK